MGVQIQSTDLPGVLVIKPQVFGDKRGFFLETFNQKTYAEAGLERVFIQDNLSHSCRGVIRGLHYQLNHPQGKLVFVVKGEIFDVAVDIRKGSPSFGQWTGVHLSENNHKQIFVPEGFAHGFCVLSDEADVIYKCTDLYTPGDDYGILWSDEHINVDWPVQNPVVSEKDQKNPCLSELAEDKLPIYLSE
ncbi:MAG: dTDP-4-dehydrorhamnose 3,5-epimerase [Sedimentisphaerales bacterium]|nr:dTDP-4-dehydrorhamnose 3,5-epimerase [Sedimentisphaerales bacterium]